MQGEFVVAAEQLGQRLSLLDRIEVCNEVTQCLEALMRIGFWQGSWEDAARLCSASKFLRQVACVPMPPFVRRSKREFAALCRAPGPRPI